MRSSVYLGRIPQYLKEHLINLAHSHGSTPDGQDSRGRHEVEKVFIGVGEALLRIRNRVDDDSSGAFRIM